MNPTQIVLALMRARGKVRGRLEDLRSLRTQPGACFDFTATEAALQSSMQRIDDRLRRLCPPEPAPLRSEEDGDSRPFDS